MAFSYRQDLTANHTMFGTGSFSNFPMLLVRSDPNLKSVSNGGHVQSTSGYDICFYLDSTLTTLLKWEVVSYNPATGDLVAWVRLSLNSLVDSTFCMAYGNSAVTTFQGDSVNVWDSNYKGVWHMGDGTTLSTADSTVNANNGTNHGGTAAAGLFGGAVSFSGSSQYIDVGNGSSLGVTGALSISAWVKPTDRSNYNGIFAKSHAANGVPAPYDMFLTQTSGVPAFLTGNGASAAFNLDFDEGDGTTSPSNGAWSYLTVTMSSGSNGAIIRWYLNGSAIGTHTVNRSNAIANLGDNAYIGTRADFVTMFKGLMQEVRLSSVARSGTWIVTEYNNQTSPGTFITSGGEVTLISPSARGGQFLNFF